MKNNIFRNIFNNTKLKEACNQWVKLNIALFFIIIFLRFFLFFKLFFSKNIDFSSFHIVLSGAFYDILLVFVIIALLLLPFVLFYYFFPKLTRIIYYALIGLYSVIHLGLIEYFNEMGEPLDHVFFTYPLSETIAIINSSVEFSLIPFIYWLVALAGIITISLLCKRIKIGVKASLPIIIVSILFFIFGNYKATVKNPGTYKDAKNYFLAVAQVPYTYYKFYDYHERKSMEKTNLEEVEQDILLYRSMFPEYNYVEDLTYPFLRLADDKDVLGDFFDKTDDGLPPNFVFFILEGLGRNLTGVINDKAVSFTPFIDSLAGNSLYWSQCLTSTGRTFGVLPTVFASVPFGKIGFASRFSSFPNHNSLLKEMHKNGYDLSFYYGGLAAFDGQQRFLQNNKVSYIADYAAKKASWGLFDRETFERAKLRIDSIENKRPNVDIYLTLTTHEPFVLSSSDEMEEYEKRVLEMCKVSGFSSAQEEKNIMNNLNIHACFLYLDDCIRDIYNYYKSLPSFKNTVFVFTGDHRMVYVQPNYLLSTYAVPLIINSPLLHSHKQMNAIISHTDITPSINAFLNKNYDYSIDEYCHWLGTSFDTTAAFTATKHLAFMKNNRDVNMFLFEDIFLYDNKLFSILPNYKNKAYKKDDYDEKLAKVKDYLNSFMAVNLYSVLNDYVYPFQKRAIDEQHNLNESSHSK